MGAFVAKSLSNSDQKYLVATHLGGRLGQNTVIALVGDKDPAQKAIQRKCWCHLGVDESAISELSLF